MSEKSSSVNQASLVLSVATVVLVVVIVSVISLVTEAYNKTFSPPVLLVLKCE